MNGMRHPQETKASGLTNTLITSRDKAENITGRVIPIWGNIE